MVIGVVWYYFEMVIEMQVSEDDSKVATRIEALGLRTAYSTDGANCLDIEHVGHQRLLVAPESRGAGGAEGVGFGLDLATPPSSVPSSSP